MCSVSCCFKGNKNNGWLQQNQVTVAGRLGTVRFCGGTQFAAGVRGPEMIKKYYFIFFV